MKRFACVINLFFFILVILSMFGCGGGGGGGSQPEKNSKAPANLTYTTISPVYTKYHLISNNIPSYSGEVTSWEISPSLPTGLNFDTSTGIISGTPTVEQTAKEYTITALNSYGSATIRILIVINLDPPMGLTYGSGSAFYYSKGVAIVDNVPTVIGSVSSWSVTPALPNGLQLDSATGVISGMPTSSQSAKNYTITASNSGGSTSITVSIVVSTEPPSLFKYQDTTPVYTEGVPIANNLPIYQGGVSSWSISPALPEGLVMSETGVISGTPVYSQLPKDYLVTAVNQYGYAIATISIRVDYAAPKALSYSTTSASYYQGMAIANNNPTVTGTVQVWSISPDLPDGLILNTSTGVISGIPTTLQSAKTYAITATNYNGSTTANISIAVKIAPPTALSYTSTSAEYTQGLIITDNIPTVTGTVASWTVSPALPSGLILNTTTGVISGAPTVAQSAQTYTITASNSTGYTTANISIAVSSSAPKNLNYSTISAEYTAEAVIPNNIPTVTGTVTSWSVSPALPGGLVLNTSTGVISGMPASGQAAKSYTITASNQWGAATRIITIAINNAAPKALSYSLQSAIYTKGEVILKNTPAVTGTVTSWSVSPALPGGLILNTTTGVISGIPEETQAAKTYTITATNSTGYTTANISIEVTYAPPAGLSYKNNKASYSQGVPILDNIPVLTGSAGSWSVSPALPTGLILDTTSGVISGIPEVLQSATTYTITASNALGSVSTGIIIDIKARGKVCSVAEISGNASKPYWYSITSSSDGSKLAAVVNGGYIYTSIDYGVTWTVQTSAGSRNWHSITSSSDGSKLAAVVYGGNIYTSADFGATWTEQISAGSRNWYSITSSSDGSRLAAVSSGNIYTSADYGATWTAQASAGSRNWRSISASSDGSKLAAVVYGGNIYTSADFGATWTAQTSAGSRNWYSITTSSDGSKLAAIVYNGYIYTSADYGATWTEQTPAGSRYWRSITSSSDGSKLAAVVSGGYIYTSTDYGATWTTQTSAGSRSWYGITSSSDGSKLTAIVYNGYIYTSADYGATWTEQTPAGSRYWRSITSSSDGSKLAAVVNGGYIYTSTDYGATWTEQTPAGSRYWRSITSSSDGSKLTAGIGSGYIYTSTDYGATWTVQTFAGSRYWNRITSSSDGSKLAAVADGGYIYTSADYGATWAAQTSAGSRSWYDITSSSDGSKLASVALYEYICTSADYGATWTVRTSAGSGNWYSITSSSDGSRLAAVASGGYISTSADYGVTWTAQTSAGIRNWRSITSSSDGMTIFAVAENSYPYSSFDGGATWIENTSAPKNIPWSCVSVSSDGRRAVAGVSNFNNLFILQ